MEISDIVGLTGVSAAFLIGLNMRTYDDTKRWLETHRADPSWNEEWYEMLRARSAARGYITYHLGAPGRHIAYRIHSKS